MSGSTCSACRGTVNEYEAYALRLSSSVFLEALSVSWCPRCKCSLHHNSGGPQNVHMGGDSSSFLEYLYRLPVRSQEHLRFLDWDGTLQQLRFVAANFRSPTPQGVTKALLSLLHSLPGVRAGWLKARVEDAGSQMVPLLQFRFACGIVHPSSSPPQQTSSSMAMEHSDGVCALATTFETNAWGTVDVLCEVAPKSTSSLDNSTSSDSMRDNDTTPCRAAAIPGSCGLYRLNIRPGHGIPSHFHCTMSECELVLGNLKVCSSDASPPPTHTQSTHPGCIPALLPSSMLRAHRWPLRFVHSYFNDSQQWQSVLCVDIPKFIPADEHIMRCDSHKSTNMSKEVCRKCCTVRTGTRAPESKIATLGKDSEVKDCEVKVLCQSYRVGWVGNTIGGNSSALTTHVHSPAHTGASTALHHAQHSGVNTGTFSGRKRARGANNERIPCRKRLDHAHTTTFQTTYEASSAESKKDCGEHLSSVERSVQSGGGKAGVNSSNSSISRRLSAVRDKPEGCDVPTCDAVVMRFPSFSGDKEVVVHRGLCAPTDLHAAVTLCLDITDVLNNRSSHPSKNTPSFVCDTCTKVPYPASTNDNGQRTHTTQGLCAVRIVAVRHRKRGIELPGGKVDATDRDALVCLCGACQPISPTPQPHTHTHTTTSSSSVSMQNDEKERDGVNVGVGETTSDVRERPCYTAVREFSEETGMNFQWTKGMVVHAHSCAVRDCCGMRVVAFVPAFDYTVRPVGGQPGSAHRKRTFVALLDGRRGCREQSRRDSLAVLSASLSQGPVDTHTHTPRSTDSHAYARSTSKAHGCGAAGGLEGVQKDNAGVTTQGGRRSTSSEFHQSPRKQRVSDTPVEVCAGGVLVDARLCDSGKQVLTAVSHQTTLSHLLCDDMFPVLWGAALKTVQDVL